jgi:hypothetical protein
MVSVNLFALCVGLRVFGNVFLNNATGENAARGGNSIEICSLSNLSYCSTMKETSSIIWVTECRVCNKVCLFAVTCQPRRHINFKQELTVNQLPISVNDIHSRESCFIGGTSQEYGEQCLTKLVETDSSAAFSTFQTDASSLGDGI